MAYNLTVSSQSPSALGDKAIAANYGLEDRQLIFLTFLLKGLLCASQKLFSFIIKPHYFFLLQT